MKVLYVVPVLAGLYMFSFIHFPANPPSGGQVRLVGEVCSRRKKK